MTEVSVKMSKLGLVLENITLWIKMLKECFGAVVCRYIDVEVHMLVICVILMAPLKDL